MRKALLLIISLVMMFSPILSSVVLAEESTSVTLPEPIKVVDFSNSLTELAKEDEAFEIEDNAAKPEVVLDDKMGRVIKLGRSVVNNREFYQVETGDPNYHYNLPYIKSEDAAYSTIHISNPFVGVEHLVEYEPYEDVKTTQYRNCNQPLWEEGITISYWIKSPSGENGYGVNSNVVGFTSNRFQMQSDDYARYICTLKYDLDYNKYTDEEKSYLGPDVVRAGVNVDSDFYFEYATEKLYNGCPVYRDPSSDRMGRTYWMNKSFIDGYVQLNDGTIEEAALGVDKTVRYDLYCEAPELGDTEEDHNPGNSRIRYAWTYSEMWLDASSSFYFENDNDKTNVQLNPNHEESYGLIMGMQHKNCFNINSWKSYKTFEEAVENKKTADSPLTKPDEWHYVTVIIQNDWVRYFLDGDEIDVLNEYSSFGTAGFATGGGGNFPWKRFNKGTGSRYGFGNNKTSTYWCYYGNYCSPTIMEWITLDCVNLTIGGGNKNGDAYCMYAETDEILIKNVVFYDTMLTEEQIRYLATEPNIYGNEYKGAKGDVNLDNKISARDALLVLKHAAGIINLDEADRYFADVSCDDNISSDDALLVLKYAAGMIEEL